MSQHPGTVAVAVVDRVARLTISNPGKHNAMTHGMWRQLPELLDGLATDPGVDLATLTGAGDSFCAGADIGGLDQLPIDERQDVSVIAEEALAHFPKPTVAVVRGACMGGGMILAAACDVRLAAVSARFAVPPARLGMVYPVGATRRLIDLVGPGWAKYLMLTAAPIGAEQAAGIGLVHQICADEQLADQADQLLGLLSGRSRLSQQASKAVINALTAPSPAEGAVQRPADLAARWRWEALTAADLPEGMAAFAQRRAPQFTWGVQPPD